METIQILTGASVAFSTGLAGLFAIKASDGRTEPKKAARATGVAAIAICIDYVVHGLSLLT